MEVTVLGTGSPMPVPERAGTAVHLEIGGDQILIDCGPAAVHRLVEQDIEISNIKDLFFTHHHIDHNADFFHFLITSWSLGRDQLTIHGPEGTQDIIEAFHELFDEDLEYRKRLEYPDTGVDEFEFIETTSELAIETDSWKISAQPVSHSITTFAYRFEEKETGAVFVFSGDTQKIPELESFASDADLLLQDACVSPLKEEPAKNARLWEHMHDPSLEEKLSNLRKTHCTAAEAGEIAAEADVGQLALTHLLPECDTEATYDEASSTFDGDIVVAEDGMSFNL